MLNINRTQDFAVSLTKVAGRHTLKAGFYVNHSFKAQNLGAGGGGSFQGTVNFGNDTNNPLDTGFGYANAAMGIFTQYAQQSQFVEGSYIYNNIEGYLQDNWKVTPRLTLDYGLRFTHQQPQYDQLLQTSRLFLEDWNASAAPMLYVPGCPGGVYPCSTSQRQARDPRTGQLLGPNTAFAIGTLVPGSGDTLNGLRIAGGGHGEGRLQVAGAGGRAALRRRLRPDRDAEHHPARRRRPLLRPADRELHLRARRQPAGLGVLDRALRPAADARQRRPGHRRPPVAQPVHLPGRHPEVVPVERRRAEDAALVHDLRHLLRRTAQLGHAERGPRRRRRSAQCARLRRRLSPPANQDPTRAPSSVPGATALPVELLRPYRGYAQISEKWTDFYQTSDSIQTAFNRRFRDGVSFGVNYTFGLRFDSNTFTPVRLQHHADGSYAYRDDQAEFDELMRQDNLRRHVAKANFVWDLPDLRFGSGASRLAAAVLNDWQLAGIFTASSGSRYSVGYSYQNNGANVNLTGSPDYAARIRILGDPGSGCSGDQYGQFNAAAFGGPLPGSVSMESGRNYLIGCPDKRLDLAVSRSFRLGGNRKAEIRMDMFNALDTVIYTGRNTTLQLVSPTNQTVRNAQYLDNGQLNPDRRTPRTAGFGAATSASAMRSLQLQLRLQF